MRDIIYWLGFSTLSSFSLATVCTWFVYHYYNKYCANNQKTNIQSMTTKFLDRCFFTFWSIFFVAMAADFKFFGPWQYI